MSVARKNFSELVNEAYYEGKLFGISKGKKPMGVLIGAREWKLIVESLKKYNKRLADVLTNSLASETIVGTIKKVRTKQKEDLNYKALVDDGRKY